jgi:hypothetical protein
MSFAIVAVLVLPVRLGGSLLGPVATPVRSTAGTFVDRRIEQEYIASVRVRSADPAPDVLQDGADDVGTYRRIYPDNYRPTRKEVSSAEPAGRPPEAI